MFIYVDPNTHGWVENKKAKKQKLLCEEIQFKMRKKYVGLSNHTVSHIKKTPQTDGNVTVYTSS